MKKIYLAAFAALALASCQSNRVADIQTPNVPQEVQGKEIELTVKVEDGITKATSVTEAGEKTVNTLQVYVFRADDNMSLDVCGMASTNLVNLKCTSGSRRIYALVNAPDIRNSVFNESDLLNSATLLSDNTSATNLVMIGKTDKTLSVPGEPVSVEVKRIASSIVLNKISTNFTSAAQQAGEFKVKGVYLINVNGKNNYAINAPTNEGNYWYNKLALSENTFPVTGICADSGLSETITPTKAYDKVHTFYAYPNAESYVSNSTWSSRATMLVVEATFKGATDTNETTYYYPIAVENIESNKKYIIPELIITRLGNDNPYEEVTFADCSFSVTVKDWDKPSMSTETI